MSAQLNEPKIIEPLKEIKNVGERQHQTYDAKKRIWNFLLASYRGGMGMQGRAGLDQLTDEHRKPHGYYAGLFKYPMESKDKYINRVAATPYRPYAKRIVNTFVNYVTTDEPERKNDAQFRELYDDVNLHGTSMRDFVKSCLIMQRVIGEFNILVDMPTSDKPPVSQYHAIASGMRPYAVPVLPHNIVDWQIGNDGGYKWALVEMTWTESRIDSESPVTVVRRTYYDAEVWQAYERVNDGKWILTGANVHPCGVTPIARITSDDYDFNPETPESWFYDLADMNRLIYNLESIDYANFENQTHGQRILPANVDDEATGKIASVSEAWTETPEEKGISRFIQPNGIEHTTVKEKMDDVREEMFRVAGLYHRIASRQVETAEAKRWDHEEMNQFLSAFSRTAEKIEKSVIRLAAKWQGKDGDKLEVTYRKDYAIDDLESTVAAALDLKTIGYTSETGRKEVIKRVYNLLVGDHVTDETMKAIYDEIDESEEEDPLLALSMAAAGNNNETPTGGE